MACAARWPMLWQERTKQPGTHGSLVAGDGKVYALSSWGRGSVIAATDEFELLASNRLPDFEEGWAVASPAIADGALLVHGERFLYKIVGGSAESPPTRRRPSRRSRGRRSALDGGLPSEHDLEGRRIEDVLLQRPFIDGSLQGAAVLLGEAVRKRET